MGIFYSAKERGFYDTRIHGERTKRVVDPEWQRPIVDITLQPGESLPDGSFTNDTAEPLERAILDADAEPVMIEIPNDECMVPADAVSISAELHDELLAGNALGKLIVSDDDGMPMLQDPPPPSAEELAATALAKRSQLLLAASHAMAPLQDAIDLGEATADEEAALLEWKRYRVALNRIDQQEGFPSAIEWPRGPQA